MLTEGKSSLNYCELYNQTSQTIRPFTGGMLLSSCMDHLSRLFLATLFSLGCGYCPIPIKMYHSPLFSDRVGIRVEELNVQAALSHNWCCSVRWMHKRWNQATIPRRQYNHACVQNNGIMHKQGSGGRAHRQGTAAITMGVRKGVCTCVCVCFPKVTISVEQCLILLLLFIKPPWQALIKGGIAIDRSIDRRKKTKMTSVPVKIYAKTTSGNARTEQKL